VGENEGVISHEGTEKADVEEPAKDYKKEETSVRDGYLLPGDDSLSVSTTDRE
jgi:hypothetical protein